MHFSVLEKAFGIALFRLYDDYDMKNRWRNYRRSHAGNEPFECATDFVLDYNANGFGSKFSALVRYFFPGCSGLYYYNPKYFSNDWFSIHLLERIDRIYFASEYKF